MHREKKDLYMKMQIIIYKNKPITLTYLYVQPQNFKRELIPIKKMASKSLIRNGFCSEILQNVI